MAFCDPLNNNNNGSNYFGNCLADCLTDLRLNELLLLKKSMEKITMKHEMNEPMRVFDDSKSVVQTDGALIDRTECIDQQCAQPQRMALMAATSSISDRGADHHHNGQQMPSWHSWPSSAIEEKPSKLQTLFQISITALSFLSFGGYLLCLIVQAIKSKGTTYFHPVATATTATANGGGVRRIKIYRRGRRAVTQKKIRQRQRSVNNNKDNSNKSTELELEKRYTGMFSQWTSKQKENQ